MLQRRHYKVVNILIKNGIDTSLCCGLEVNSDLKYCFNWKKGIVEFCLQKDVVQDDERRSILFAIFNLAPEFRLKRFVYIRL